MPIGMAIGGAWMDDGVATWRLIVNGVELPGLWVVVDRSSGRSPLPDIGPDG